MQGTTTTKKMALIRFGWRQELLIETDQVGFLVDWLLNNATLGDLTTLDPEGEGKVFRLTDCPSSRLPHIDILSPGTRIMSAAQYQKEQAEREASAIEDFAGKKEDAG